MNGCADYAPSPSDPSKEPMEPWPSQAPLQEDVDMSDGTSGNETNENGSTGRDSRGSNCDDSGRELGMLVGLPGTCQGPGTFSVMMVKSEHHPSTSGYSSEQSTKVDAHKELIKTLKELKVHLPVDKRAKGKASTLLTLKYALRSVKQMKASEEYYQLLMSSEDHPCTAHVPSCTVEEIESVTSEFIVKNVDMFAAAVSLVTGKILYISDQVVSIFHCKRGTFHDTKFVEFLAPHDVGVFHSRTTPCKLPPWSVRHRADSFTQECVEEKSFFCRVSAGAGHESELRYHPFRTAPCLAQARDQLCCVLLAERVRSGYEAPRIPPEKRIFTTTHSPNCLFQDVDERAVPLLGHPPQDLIETPVLVQLRPSDRPLMLATHKKIVQSGGQPFDYSPIRFRARNGEYVTLDTSWSSFINPWTRQISFVIGRHRVRVGPLNEDVFSAQTHVEEKALQPSTQELTEQIHRLLLQPVPHSSSSGYGSLGSSGSHEHLLSQTSSSECTGQEDPCRRRAEICKNGKKVKSKSPCPDESGEQKNESAAGMQSSSPAQMKALAATEKDRSRASLPEAGLPEELAFKSPLAGSYQQISCLDSVVRYLESCSKATTLKRKCEFPAHLPTQKASDKRRATAGPGPHAAETASPFKVNSHTDVSTHLTSLTLPSKAQSVASLTSQCSYSSTIVHVGDKKPQPELETVGDAASGPGSLDCLAGSVLPCGLGHEQGPFRKLGLTKEVLAAHTQREEQSFLLKFREIRKLSVFQSRCHYYSQDRCKGQSSERAAPGLRNTSGIDSSWKKTGKNRKLKSKRVKPRDSSGSPGSGGPPPQRLPLVGLNATAWSPSDTSQPSCPAMPSPTPVPAYSLPMFPAPGIVPAPGTVAVAPGTPHAGLALPVDTQREFAVQPPPSAGPLPPVVALVSPSCSFSPVTPSLPPAFFPGQPNLPSEVIPASQPEFPGRTSSPKHPHTCALAECGLPVSRVAAQAALPSAAGSAGRTSPPLFQSRGSSPLQLSLLQLEEAPEGGCAAAGPTGPTETVRAGPDCQPGSSWDRRPKAPPTCDKPKDAQGSDALCTPSGLLHLLLREDLCSAMGSAPSGSGASVTSYSLGSGSLGCDASASGAGSSNTSHTSKYFGSVDSSENNHRAKVKVDMAESERLRDVLQDPVWLLGADTDDSVMMAYQMPSRNLETVLQEDREKLKVLQRLQPRFTDRQRQELQDVHPWMRSGGLPAAFDVAECVCCENKGKDNVCMRYEEATPTLGLSGTTDTTEEENGPSLSHRNEGQT
ncbi:period circadian protein homolog 2 isoform X1 [Lagenorhynchus albirostris]|uniref:period circadian protein homolog 2 isoform X1 n=2 Tax=Lagenorhynchus albirostris TaxID=27610 RepID=UPI0028EEC3F3|nr:period circadian protein homolog 2 isoform X1 [Lagenorhynchus albirostris]XP_060007665.1 period circadian protein homolog 2 isoform X1 [Lagenorhynchus albirostris]